MTTQDGWITKDGPRMHDRESALRAILAVAERKNTARFNLIADTARIATRSTSAQTKTSETFQSRVAPWMQECFGAEIASDVRERGDRLLEKVLELIQSHGYDPARVATLHDYVFGRPVGEPRQEVDGVMVSLGAYCLATGQDMHAAGEIELARISEPEVVKKIRAKQKSKRGLHTPLPVPPAAAANAGSSTDT